jgi:putative ABC transport system substrate-binding protein
MRRREILALLGGGAALWPLGARAQQPGKVYRVGVLAAADNPIMRPAYQAFLEELRAQGFVENQNLVVDQRSTDRAPAALAGYVGEMVRAKVDVIFTGSRPALQAVASTGIPVVISANNYDPIADGYVKSLSQPGGNVTGVALRQTELAEKQVELGTQAFPHLKRLAVQWDAISSDQFSAAERRATALGLDVVSIKYEQLPYDIDAAFRKMADAGAQQFLYLSTPFMGRYAEDVIGMAIQRRLPAMFIFRRYVELGGLMSYGTDNVTMYRQAAVYVAKVLRGARPADLPVEQPNKFELAVNLKTAKLIGVELPTSILLRADSVIE